MLHALVVFGVLVGVDAVAVLVQEKIAGGQVDSAGLLVGNIIVIASILLLSGVIFRQRDIFTNRSKYLF